MSTKVTFRKVIWRAANQGKQLIQLNIFVGSINGIGSLYLYSVVDTCCGFAFGRLSDSKQQKTAIALLYRVVLPILQRALSENRADPDV